MKNKILKCLLAFSFIAGANAQGQLVDFKKSCPIIGQLFFIDIFKLCVTLEQQDEK